MSKKTVIGRILIVIGALLLIGALSLYLYNRYDADRASTASTEAEEKLSDAMLSAVGSEYDLSVEEDENGEAYSVISLTVGDDSYIGILSIPSFGLELPVLSEWSYAGLKNSPARYTGSASAGNLVICAHNYERHFGNIKDLSIGASITFTDVTGTVYEYEVTEVETIQPTAITEMITGDWDLTLFTCNYSGQARVAVRCKLVS
ncbi:MAG: sortase [Oscillospiraceae bacterium]|nr:sortase [Oscillospiraceae bacterium]